MAELQRNCTHKTGTSLQPQLANSCPRWLNSRKPEPQNAVAGTRVITAHG